MYGDGTLLRKQSAKSGAPQLVVDQFSLTHHAVRRVGMSGRRGRRSREVRGRRACKIMSTRLERGNGSKFPPSGNCHRFVEYLNSSCTADLSEAGSRRVVGCHKVVSSQRGPRDSGQTERGKESRCVLRPCPKVVALSGRVLLVLFLTTVVSGVPGGTVIDSR